MQILILLCSLLLRVSAEDEADSFYKKIGVAKDATIKEIRKAYKQLALTMHPDKSDDPNAHEKFSEITRIYETLKDDELRKKYDRWGEKGLEDDFNPNRGQYQSWEWYEDLGLYDNDEQIQVLDRMDLFEAISSNDLWFIKFYSERCSHCNDLAPAFRELAIQMEGVAKFGAISCRDYRQTCGQLSISGYPTLLLFAPGGNRYRLNGEDVRKSEPKYKMARDVDTMRDYILKFAKINIKLLGSNVKADTKKPTIYIVSNSDGESPFPVFPDQYILSNRLSKSFNLFNVNCDGGYDPRQMCSKRTTDEGGVFFFDGGYFEKIESFDTATVIRESFKKIKLASETKLDRFLGIITRPTIAILNGGGWSDSDMEALKSLNTFIEEKKRDYSWISYQEQKDRVVEINCDDAWEICDRFQRFESKILVFSGRHPDQYEVYHGEITHSGIMKFAQEIVSSNVYQVTPKNHKSLRDDGAEWFYDFSAPWCPPCRNFLPHIRYVSKTMANQYVKFAYVDCQAYKSLCNQYQVQSYPTIKFYGFDAQENLIEEEFDGDHHWEDIQNFYEDVKNPSVEKLTDQSFYQKVVGRDEGEIWFIDFAANWCRPCQHMLPEFKEAAKSLRGRVNFGYVECTQYQGICQGFGIESYPSLFLFPAKTTNNIDPDLVKFNYQRRDSYAFFHFLSNNIKTKQPVADARMIVDFDKYIQQQDKPILIDFFASWCGPCQEFMPIFQFANALMDDVLFIKVDCETGKGKSICQKFKIRQYPTVILYQKDQSMKSGYRKTEIDTDFNLNELLSSVEAKIIKRQNKKNDSAHDEL